MLHRSGQEEKAPDANVESGGGKEHFWGKIRLGKKKKKKPDGTTAF